MENRSALIQKGINYDTGTNFSPGSLSREYSLDKMKQEIRAIRHQLHCNSIQIYGTDTDRLMSCAKEALETGLHVWLQPRLVEGTQQQTLDHLLEVATAAEQLRQTYDRIDMSLGCELSVFSSGIIPGRTHAERASKLWKIWWLLPWFNHKLNSYLRKASVFVRSNFKGKISYGAALWEKVNWNIFDLIGLNLYKLSYNEQKYVKNLRSFHRHNKPIIIFEFGCGSFEGAKKLGPESHALIDWSASVPEIKGSLVRNEQEQADYIIELLNLYKAENIYGAFVYDFIQPFHPYSPDPKYDLDMVGYGIVKVNSDENNDNNESDYWEPKLSFHEISSFYKQN